MHLKPLMTASFLLLAWSCKDRTAESDPSNTPQLFQLLSKTETGIDFINEVSDQENFNILTYRNFYNGGGVAIGDINNDGLPDLYFTANQKKNKLYLNKGNFKFQDITEQAGVGGTMTWSTGVTMADVNSDGLLDIYVCNSGDVSGNLKKNELFINNGNLTFTERAHEYNLDNDGYSTHAAFFDYDNDGDLDCYILNNSFRNPERIELYRSMRDIASPGGDKLMRNDGKVFTDVTKEAGLYSSDIAFGLGVAVSDINGDHLPDLFISNDFWERDYLYINKGNGKFSEELAQRVDYCSLASMGADIADINNDGAPEIFTTDMLSANNYRQKTTMSFDPYHLEDMKYRANYHYQFTQNCLQLNDGAGSFSEVGLMSGVAATDWSWGALIFDFENDGRKDIFVSNGIAKDIGSMDFIEFYGNGQDVRSTSSTVKTDYGKFINSMSSTPLANYAFSNGGDLQFKNRAASLGFSQTSFSNGAAYGDLDNDGDPDLVVNNINATCFVYRNESKQLTGNHYLKVKFEGPIQNKFGIGAEVKLTGKNGLQVLQNYNTRGFQSSIEPMLLFGVGNATTIDTLTATWPNGKMQQLVNVKTDQLLTLKIADANTMAPPIQVASTIFQEESTVRFDQLPVHHEDRYNDFETEVLLPRMFSTEGPRIIKGDVNNDQRTDFILLGAAGDPEKLYVQSTDGRFIYKNVAAFNKNPSTFESTCGAFIDFDQDGDLDLLIGSGGNEIQMEKTNFIVRAYANDGSGNFSISPTAAPRVIGNFSTMESVDFDKDGDLDLFLGARLVPGNYGLRPRSFLLRNDNGAWTDISSNELANVGMVTDAAWSDIDADGDNDLVVVGDWMPVTIFNNEAGQLLPPTTIPNSSGWWTRVKSADLDGDGDNDLVLGNWGLNTKFQATDQHPLTMFVKDFDNNGKTEFIINWYPPDDTTAYPFAPKPELTAQLPGLRKQILRYADYGHKTYDSLFTPAMKEGAIRYDASVLQTSVAWNNKGTFTLETLPVEAQCAPVFGIVTDDLDGDGRMDIWLGGNFYNVKPQVGRHNASKGIFMKGDGKQGFQYVSPLLSGIHTTGEVRDATVIEVNKSKQLLVARNNASMLSFKRK